ncbi:bone morphogenetic protein 2-like [Heterodontus francisci]|uniref:bone morphogenetic protein 2-like n=1 Tax=Heterodontus francisci TaxID=7792 RepID=UPI00355C9080
MGFEVAAKETDSENASVLTVWLIKRLLYAATKKGKNTISKHISLMILPQCCESTTVWIFALKNTFVKARLGWQLTDNTASFPGKRDEQLITRACHWAALLSPLSILSFGAPVEKKGEAIEDRVVSEAIQRLHEVLEIGELPQKAGPRRRPPQYMLDLFNSVADVNGITKTPGLLEGDVVRSFVDKVHGDQSYFYFNVTSVGKDEQLLKAELRLFKLKEQSQHTPHLCRVDLCELLDGTGVHASLISSKTIPLYSEGWEVFTVTQTVSTWVKNSSSNYGFMIITSIPAGNSLELSPVIFAKSGDHGCSSRMTEEDNILPKEKKLVVSTMPGENAIHSLAQVARSRRRRAVPVLTAGLLLPYQKHSLYVDFEQIGWSSWIISPRGYSAYYCKGSCPFPLGQGFRATNHAAVQSIVNGLKLSKEVGTPCCVPDAFHSINLLYFDNEENVVLKQYDDMVAVSCGCH